MGTLERTLCGEDASARRRVRRGFVGTVDDGLGGRWIVRLLAGAEGSELAEMAVEAGRTGRFGANGLTKGFIQAARNSGSEATVREAVVDRVSDEAADWFVLQLLAVSKGDVEWLLDAVEPGRAGQMLMVLLSEAEDTAVRSVMSDGRLADRVLAALGKTMPSSAREMARILALDVIEADMAFDMAFDVAEALSRDERKAFEGWIVNKALSTAVPGDVRVERAVRSYGTALSPENLVEEATATWIPRHRVGANLVILDAATAEIRDGVVGAVDLLSRRLVQRRPENLGVDAYGAWARLLRDVDDERDEVRVDAAGTALGFAFRKVSYPVSELVVVSFPTVYAKVAQFKALGKVGGDVRALSSYFPLSWKKPEEGRGKLVDALVEAFLGSSWPPADLVLAAMDAGIENRVVKQVRRRSLGPGYLEKVHRDAGRLEVELRRRVRRCLYSDGL